MNALRFITGMRIDGRDVYITSQCRSMFSGAGAWLQYCPQLGSRRAVWLRWAGSQTDVRNVRKAEENEYECRLYQMPHRFRRRINDDELLQSSNQLKVDLVCFHFSFSDN